MTTQYAEAEMPWVVSIGESPSAGRSRAPLGAIIAHVANYDVKRSPFGLIPLTYGIIGISDDS